MNTFFLSAKDVNLILQRVGAHRVMCEMIERLTMVLHEFDRQTFQMPLRDGFTCEAENGLIEWMPLLRRGNDVVIKVVSYFPNNPINHNASTIQALVGSYDAMTGRIRTLMDGQLLTALRTGAASAIASRVLASPDSTVLGLVGCGYQAVTQAHALCSILPIRTIYAFDVCKHTLDSLHRRLSFLNVEVMAAPLSEVEARADVLCTATSVPVGAGPIISGTKLQPHIHINAIGSDFPGKTELPYHVVTNALVCPDSKDQAIREGESQKLSNHEIGPELHTLVKDIDNYKTWRTKMTIFDSTGIAIEDAVAMDVLTNLAKEIGIGRELDLCFTAPDPKDPYALVNLISPSRSCFATGTMAPV